jgi:hypothetical protein
MPVRLGLWAPRQNELGLQSRRLKGYMRYKVKTETTNPRGARRWIVLSAIASAARTDAKNIGAAALYPFNLVTILTL